MVPTEILMKFTEEQLRELAGIFDDIITSESEAVKSAFHRLAFLSSLAQQTREEPGPFSDMFTRLDWMERELGDLRRDIQIVSNGGAIKQTEIRPEDLIINLGGYSVPSSTTATMLGGSGMNNTLTIQPLTSNDIVSLGSIDLTTFTLTDTGNNTDGTT